MLQKIYHLIEKPDLIEEDSFGVLYSNFEWYGNIETPAFKLINSNLFSGVNYYTVHFKNRTQFKGAGTGMTPKDYVLKEIRLLSILKLEAVFSPNVNNVIYNSPIQI
jgi:hypothetical protein